MKYWSNLRRERSRSSATTLNMVAEFIEEQGYEIIAPPVANASVGAVVPACGDNTHAQRTPANALQVCLCSKSDIAKGIPFNEKAGSHLVILEDGAVLPGNLTERDKRLLARSIVARCTGKEIAIDQIETEIANFIISIERFSSCLAQGVNSSNQYQALVDVAEDFFNNFISIVDANNLLLAYTKHIQPIDDMNRSLVRYKYHTSEMLAPSGSHNYMVMQAGGQEGVSVFPPTRRANATVVGSPILVNNVYAGYAVMTCNGSEVRSGTQDAFALFVGFCEKVAALRSDTPAGHNPHSQNLLLTLLSRQTVDTIFVEHQARQLAIPTSGAYKLIRIVWPDDIVAQMPFFVDEINRSSADTRIAVCYENAIIALVCGGDATSLNAATTRIVDSFPANIAHKIIVSETLSSLFEIYFAYRSLKSVEKYELSIIRYKEPPQEDKPLMLSFRDAFSFYWDDPLRDTSIANFAVKHMVVNEIERVDQEKHTDDLDLLEAFLVSERKASVVAESHHLHRNGVLYRIKRIQERYNIDLGDHLTRQYLLSCLRIRATVHTTPAS